MVQFKFQHLKELFLNRTTFCCCLPVRLGAIILSLLGVLFAGFLSLILWFEVADGNSLTSTQITIFTVIALLETLLLVACLLGFIGLVVRKQLFVQIYAYFLYVHLVINIGVAIYLLVIVSQFTTAAAYHACLGTIKDPGAQKQCIGFLQVGRGIYVGVSTALIFIEIYAAIIVARYVNQIQGEKRLARTARQERIERYKMRTQSSTSSSSAPDVESLLPPVAKPPGALKQYLEEWQTNQHHHESSESTLV